MRDGNETSSLFEVACRRLARSQGSPYEARGGGQVKKRLRGSEFGATVRACERRIWLCGVTTGEKNTHLGSLFAGRLPSLAYTLRLLLKSNLLAQSGTVVRVSGLTDHMVTGLRTN